MNKVMLYGNVGADPELKVTAGGQAILKLRMATSETYYDKSNTKVEKTEWHSVTVFGKRAEALAKIVSKGMKLLVEGGLHTSSYERDGEMRYRTEVNAREVYLPGKGGARNDNAGGEQRQQFNGGGGQRQTFGGNNGGAPPNDDFGGGGGWEPDDEILF